VNEEKSGPSSIPPDPMPELETAKRQTVQVRKEAELVRIAAEKALDRAARALRRTAELLLNRSSSR
jgi:hypothetical protein